MGRPTALRISALLLLLAGVPATATPRYDPQHRYRTIVTRHFVIYFHQDEDALAADLAIIAEDAWLRLRHALGATPPSPTHVVLVDETELSNGWATPLPYNTIEVTAVWPAGSDFIGNTADWLRLAFTHEFTHIVHLDRSEGWARLVRGVFGRTAIAFPNLFLPTWQIEGLAAYEESAVTGEGRLHAGDFRAIAEQAARARALPPLDRINGGLTDWPDGLAPYAYGLGFHAYLADRFGEDRFAKLAVQTAGRVPFTASRVFKRVYSESLAALWRQYEAQASAPSVAAPSGATEVNRLTRHGFTVSGPRFSAPPCAGCPAEVIYSVHTPHEFPALNLLKLDGTMPSRLATRYLGSTAAVGRDTIYFDQQEERRNTGLYSDLYALDRASGRVTPLTSEARLLDPDLSPDEQTLACVRNAPGRRDLVLVRLAAGARAGLKTRAATKVASIVTLISEPNTQFNSPRWSPDGRTLAVERHRRGRLSDIVLVDATTKDVRTTAARANTRFVTPAWRPDGRALVIAGATEDDPFQLYEAIVGDTRVSGHRLRPMTRAFGGALWPDVSPDGRSIVYVGYTADGFDLFQMPYRAADTRGESPAEEESNPDEGRDTRPPQERPPDQIHTPAEYSPSRTLRPTAWTPIVEADRHQLRLGAATSGSDVLGYHAYGASATWRVKSPSAAPALSAATADWRFSYAYNRWRSTVWLSASSTTSFFAGPPTDAGTAPAGTLRERQLEAGVVFPVLHVRTSQTAFASLVRAVDDFAGADGPLTRNRTAARAAWMFNSAQTYGYSISPERGATLGLTTELVRQALGATADATIGTVDGRAFLPGLARHHVAAIRIGAGMSAGDRGIGRTFLLGGGAPNLNPIDFGREAISLLRGFRSDTFAGTRVALMNADYRWPIARPQRGIGTWPIFLHTVHAAVFGDAGHAWTTRFSIRDVKASAGGELSLNIVAAYSLPFTATIGAAWARDGSRRVGDGGSLYARVGRAF